MASIAFCSRTISRCPTTRACSPFSPGLPGKQLVHGVGTEDAQLEVAGRGLLRAKETLRHLDVLAHCPLTQGAAHQCEGGIYLPVNGSAPQYSHCRTAHGDLVFSDKRFDVIEVRLCPLLLPEGVLDQGTPVLQ